jgi:hypothetical protein
MNSPVHDASRARHAKVQYHHRSCHRSWLCSGERTRDQQPYRGHIQHHTRQAQHGLPPPPLSQIQTHRLLSRFFTMKNISLVTKGQPLVPVEGRTLKWPSELDELGSRLEQQQQQQHRLNVNPHRSVFERRLH